MRRFVLIISLVLFVLFLLSGGAWPWIVANGTAIINGVLAGNTVSILVLIIVLLLAGIVSYKFFGH